MLRAPGFSVDNDGQCQEKAKGIPGFSTPRTSDLFSYTQPGKFCSSILVKREAMASLQIHNYS